MRRLVMALMCLLLVGHAQAAIEAWHFRNETQEQQFRDITSGLRCPKCQNTSIADSDAMIAADMRQKVFELLQQGQSPSQITAYMVSRYGNFVSYQPPVTASTLPLWLVPGLFILAGIAFLVLRVRRREAGYERLSDDERARLNELLEKGSEQ